MLEIKNITKVYKDTGVKSTALDGVSVNFRANEFVSILGPSGSGKTTFLNIVGGLDHYTSGDLVINGVSTRRYKDVDWDSYRNHKIGFIFQSYNLIPHQTILKNVALALNLSGVSRKEAEKRAKAALKEVGLEKHVNKRPAQLSGGQMQRVAIARALVNNPDILLADEPTGALDSETSVQIMNLLKEIAAKKLVIMVTHNPELAKEYSTRIIDIKDGKIVSDSMPLSETQEKAETKKQKTRRKKTKMSLATSFRLSASNLLTKKARTILVAVAGSIGIIGIALVLAISNGFQRYVDDIESDTLTSYPLTIRDESSNLTSLLLTATGESSQKAEDGTLVENQVVANTLGSLSVNDLRSFKQYLETNQEKYAGDVSNLSYNYSVEPLIYTHDTTGKLAQLNPSELINSMMGGLSSLSSKATSVFFQSSNNDPNYVAENYEMLAGKWPEKYDELVIVLKNRDEIPDILVYYLGLRDTSELEKMMTSIMTGEVVEIHNEPKIFSYDDLMSTKLKLVEPAKLYQYNSEYNIFEKMTDNVEYMEKVYQNATDLKITGIAVLNDELAISGSGIGYRPELIQHIVETAAETDIVKKQLANEEVDVFSNKRFDEENTSLGLNFADFVTVDEGKMKSAFNTTIDKTALQTEIANYMASINQNITADTSTAQTDFDAVLRQFLSEIKNELPSEFYQNEIETIVNNYLGGYNAAKALSDLNQKYVIPKENLKEIYAGLLKSYLTAYIGSFVAIYGQVPEFVAAHPELFADANNYGALKDNDFLDGVSETFLGSAAILKTEEKIAETMTEAKMKQTVLTAVSNLTTYLSETFSKSINVDPEALTSAFRLNLTEEEITRIVTAMLKTSDSTAKTNLISLGYQDENEPTSIEIYFTSFEGKEHFLKLIEEYNNSVPEEKQIKYNDTTGILMSSVKTIVDAVTYVLIGFVSVSLVVSSIMIGVITYISVYERTKEIGILRAIGASKRNISTIFNAETFIIGLLSGAFAIAISYLLILLINVIILNLTGIENLSAYLTPTNALILVVLSVALTLIGGLIPAKSASKKDPVEALRSE